MSLAPSPNLPNEPLTAAIEQLGGADSLPLIMEVIRQHARRIAAADGATFILREGSNCFYADEDAIGPLWKGRRFAQTTCISGWVMMNRQPAVIENVFEDPRIPIEAYQPTFVRSLAMIPVGEATPMAAIGCYWAKPYRATREQVATLRELAAHTFKALGRVR